MGSDGVMRRRPSGFQAWITTDIRPNLPLPNLGEGTDLEWLIRFFGTHALNDNRDTLPGWKLPEIGHTLTRAFLQGEALPPGGGWIRLVPERGRRHFSDDPNLDGFVRTLPWPLLAEDLGGGRYEFLSRVRPDLRWIVTPAAADQRAAEIRFPGAPRVLLAMPNPETIVPPGKTARDRESLVDTGARDHFDELETKLLAGLTSESKRMKCQVRRVFTWTEFRDALRKEPYPEVVYFYGHGKAFDDDTYLAFLLEESVVDGIEGGPRGWGRYIPLTSIAGQLRELVDRGQRPLLFYANCCQGDTDRRHGIGAMLAGMTAATIANRGFIPPDDARVIGRGLLTRVLSEGLSPHLALLDLYERDITALGDYEDGARWAVPVLYANYVGWVPQALANRANTYQESLRRAYYSVSIPEQVGRDEALREAGAAVSALLASNEPGLQVLFWRAPPRQGLLPFSNRLHDELRESFPDNGFSQVLVELQRPEQPASTKVLASSFRRAITEALDRDIDPGAPDPNATDLLQRRLPATEKQRDLLLVSHRGVSTNDVDFIRKYLLFWQDLFDNATRGRKGRVVLAIPVSCATPTDSWASPVPVPTTTAASRMVTIDLTPAFGSLSLAEIITHMDRFSGPYGITQLEPADEPAADILSGSQGGAFDDVVARLRLALAIQP